MDHMELELKAVGQLFRLRRRHCLRATVKLAVALCVVSFWLLQSKVAGEAGRALAPLANPKVTNIKFTPHAQHMALIF